MGIVLSGTYQDISGLFVYDISRCKGNVLSVTIQDIWELFCL